MTLPPTPSAVASPQWVACNLCGRTEAHPAYGVERLVRCTSCGLLFVSPRTSPEDIVRRYDGAYFHAEEPVSGGYEDYEADRADILRTFRRRLPLIRPLPRSGALRVLDVGCATGMFLEVAREAGWSAQGVDVSAYAVEQAQRKGFDVHCGTLPGVELPHGSFDVVTMWDLIEHVPDPLATLEACRRLLAPGGILVAATPDAGSALAMLLRERWLGFRCIGEHLYFFTRRTMAQMLRKAGFEVHRHHTVGKYLALQRVVTRLRFYTRIGAVLLRTADRVAMSGRLYLNPLDTLCVVAVRPRT